MLRIIDKLAGESVGGMGTKIHHKQLTQVGFPANALIPFNKCQNNQESGD